jgi:protein ImuB
MLWLALHLPLLSLEAFCATLPADTDALADHRRPVALADHRRPVALIHQHRITAVNAAAAGAGIRPGMKRATALALLADLVLADSDAARDAAALQAVAHAALAFTPAVTLQDAQTVLLEVQASLRLFGGPAALQQRLAAALAPLGHRVQMAAAPTALGAALLARWHPADRGDLVLGAHARQLPALQRLLDAAPVWMLGPGREHWEALQGMGLHTLSDLRRLPRAGLARRFGAGLLDDLDRALGLQPDPRSWLALPAVFDSRLELFANAETGEQVLAGAAVLLARLVAWAQARQARVGAFTLRMRHERQRQAAVPATELRVELAAPALDAAHLQSLLGERLARCTLAAPALELQLHCRHLVAGSAPSGELFPTRASQDEGLLRLLERLRARLGDEQVQRLEPVADHRPERASRAVPAQGPATTAAAAAAAMAVLAASPLPHHRPAWLLPEPLPLAECGTLPLLEGRPLQLVSGPERIEAGWWDGAPAVRDYFIAQAEDGSLVWIWRGRLPAAAGEAGWFLQGRFA